MMNWNTSTVSNLADDDDDDDDDDDAGFSYKSGRMLDVGHGHGHGHGHHHFRRSRYSMRRLLLRMLMAHVPFGAGIMFLMISIRPTYGYGYALSSFTGSTAGILRSTENNCHVHLKHRISTATYSSPECWITMKLRVGILGLPNVGKSSLFNALARQSLAQAANFPFCTIDPTTCLVPCPAPYLERLAEWSPTTGSTSPATNGHRRNRKPATMEWVDVAGLAKNAHRGEGLGNQFLGTLRDCTCLCHVVRAFEDPNILVHQVEEEEEHGSNKSPPKLCDPLRDMETIQLELVLADLAHVRRRLERIGNNGGSSSSSSSEDSNEDERRILEQIEAALQEGIPARALHLSAEEQLLIKSMGLLTLKPVVYAFNVDEVDFFLDRPEAEAKAQQVVDEFEHSFSSLSSSATAPWVLVCANIESHLAQCTADEQAAYLESIGADAEQASLLCYQVLPTLVRQLLGYSIVYTGPGVPLERSETTRAHLIPQQSSPFTAYDLAGRIHGDIQKGFLRAQVVPASELLERATDFVHAKELGILLAEGKDYVLQAEEVILLQWKGG